MDVGLITDFEVGTLAHHDLGATHQYDLAPDRQARIASEDDPTWQWRQPILTDAESRSRIELDAGAALDPHATSSANDESAAMAKAEDRGANQRDIPYVLCDREP